MSAVDLPGILSVLLIHIRRLLLYKLIILLYNSLMMLYFDTLVFKSVCVLILQLHSLSLTTKYHDLYDLQTLLSAQSAIS